MAVGLNQSWVADVIFLPTRAGFVFLVVVLAACSRLDKQKSVKGHNKRP